MAVITCADLPVSNGNGNATPWCRLAGADVLGVDDLALGCGTAAEVVGSAGTELVDGTRESTRLGDPGAALLVHAAMTLAENSAAISRPVARRSTRSTLSWHADEDARVCARVQPAHQPDQLRLPDGHTAGRRAGACGIHVQEERTALALHHAAR